MAEVHKVQEANDKSKFHRQIKTCWSEFYFAAFLLSVLQKTGFHR